jgi:fumarylpyruvate hydrolase
MIALLSRYFTLRPGDLIFTGTPEGVGPVVAGDALHAEIAGLMAIDLKVV